MLLVNLIFHVVLRGVWISTVGLRYVSEDIDFDVFRLHPRFDRFLRKHVISFDHYIEFDPNFASLSVELIEFLAERNVLLVGIDTPSIGPANSKELPCHRAIFKKELAVLEGLDLSEVPAGFYELMAFPLAISGAEASPVRAILRK